MNMLKRDLRFLNLLEFKLSKIPPKLLISTECKGEASTCDRTV